MSGKKVLFISLLLGLLAAFLVLKQQLMTAGGGNSTAVVVSNELIKAGQEIKEVNLKLVKWPQDSMPSGISSDLNKVVGRVATKDIMLGEPILDAMLAPLNTHPGLAAILPVGKRAITVKVNEVIAVAGFALPGSYVDVLASVKGQGGSIISKTLLNRVKVLAVAQETDVDPQKPKVVSAVTLELTPKESEALDLARSVGNLSLVLRNEHDEVVESSRGTHFDEVFGNGAPAPAEGGAKTSSLELSKPTKRVDKVEVLKGTNKSEVTF